MDKESIIDFLRGIIRAKNGLPKEDDIFQGLIHSVDDRERTKLTTRNIFRHTYMDLLSLKGGSEWSIMKDWAEDERHLFISENGERATAFIASMKKQQEPIPMTNISTTVNPVPQEEKKKGWLRR